ncbi:nitroreductase family protein [Shouchella sp. 1P09AA]|uniref:nitroreductase family protein n=1 Tax=unclassified Shouchella TaxID=2893065 RepID=UPI0039A1DD39
MNLWDYKLDIKDKFINYHFSSIKAKEFAPNQTYQEINNPKTTKSYPDQLNFDLNYQIAEKNIFENTLSKRNSQVSSLNYNGEINEQLISRFCQLAFFGNKLNKRNYPSGGALYNVEINFIFKEFTHPSAFYKSPTISFIQDLKLVFAKNTSWESVQSGFLGDIPENVKFIIALSTDLNKISLKYNDIGYKLVQQEVGHMGQNILLVANYLGLGSIPLQSYIDLELNKLLDRKGQVVLSTYLLG